MLKWNSLWDFIEASGGLVPRESAALVVDEEPFEIYRAWWKGDDHTRIVLRTCVKGDLYHDIEHCYTAREA